MEGFHKLKLICPYEIIKIEAIKVSNKPNEHGYLYLKCLVDDNINFKYALGATIDDTIILYEELENGEKSIIFNGITENVYTTNDNGIYYLELEGVSRSSLLDIKEKTRSFQDIHMSYDNLIKEILKDYNGLGFIQGMNEPRSIGRPLFQYKETDYEFLKRVASHLGLEIICDIINSGNAFYFGRPEGKRYETKGEMNYKACKDLERYYKAKSRGFSVKFFDTDFFYYEVENPVKMDIGDKIYFKGKDLYINQYEAELYKGDIIYKYRFCIKNGIWQDKIYNKKIKGVSLEGEVLETRGEKLKLHLYIDESQEPSKAAWFYYAPPTGNILYSMPIVGESARLYFQDEIDAAPIVTGCVRKNGSTCEDMSDTTNRYFATESGDYFDMLPGAINFHRNGLKVNLNDESGITLSSSGNLSIGAGGVSLSAGSVSINGTSKIKVQKGKSGYISLENEFYSEAGATCECGSDRQSYKPFTDDEPTAGVAEALAKKAIVNGIIMAMGALIGAMQGIGASTKGITASDQSGSSGNDATVFNETMDYENGADVTLVAADGTAIKGKAYQAFGTDDNPSKHSQFMPDDWNSYNEHNSALKTAESDALGFINGAKNVAIDMARPFVGPTPDDIEAFKQSKGYDVTADEMLDFYNSGQKGLDYISDKSGEFLRKASPYTKQFDLFSFASEIAIDTLMLVDGLIGLTKVAVKGFSFLKGGLKIAESKGLGNLIEDIFKIKNDEGIVAGEKILEDMDLGGIKPEEIDLEGTEIISRDSEIISDKDIYKDLEANGGYKGLEVNEGYKELEVNDGYKEPVYKEPEVNSGYKEPEYDYKTNEEENYNTKGVSEAEIERSLWGTFGDVPIASDFYEGADAGIIRGSTTSLKYYSVPNEAGGSVYVTTDWIRQSEFAKVVDEASGEVKILSGTHGDIDGALQPDIQLLNEDIARWGNNSNVKIYDTTKMTDEELAEVLNSDGTIVCGWCLSERSTAVLKALGLIK